MKAEHVNPFILSVCKIMKDMCMLDLKIGTPSTFQGAYPEDASLIQLGIIGGLTGEVLLNLDHQTALGVVSKMMMMPVDAMDAIGESAISELGNMIAGNAATVFANQNIFIDITPPTYCLGSAYPANAHSVFRIPFRSEAGELTVDIFIE